MKCKICGSELDPGSWVCKYCGYDIGREFSDKPTIHFPADNGSDISTQTMSSDHQNVDGKGIESNTSEETQVWQTNAIQGADESDEQMQDMDTDTELKESKLDNQAQALPKGEKNKIPVNANNTGTGQKAPQVPMKNSQPVKKTHMVRNAVIIVLIMLFLFTASFCVFFKLLGGSFSSKSDEIDPAITIEPVQTAVVASTQAAVQPTAVPTAEPEPTENEEPSPTPKNAHTPRRTQTPDKDSDYGDERNNSSDDDYGRNQNNENSDSYYRGGYSDGGYGDYSNGNGYNDSYNGGNTYGDGYGSYGDSYGDSYDGGYNSGSGYTDEYGNGNGYGRSDWYGGSDVYGGGNRYGDSHSYDGYLYPPMNGFMQY